MRTTPELLAKLDAISISTVGRILRRLHQDEPRLPRKGPESANRVAREVPTTRIAWHETQPGHLEIDLVHHGGTRTEGEYAHSLQMIDVATCLRAAHRQAGWSERVAVLGRSYRVMSDALRYTRQRIPFPILEVHSDDGAEFLNRHLVRFWKDDLPHLDLTPSRPYHENDNLFQPVMRLADKVVVSENGRPTRIRRVFDDARTPFDRLCTTDAIPPDGRAALEAWPACAYTQTGIGKSIPERCAAESGMRQPYTQKDTSNRGKSAIGALSLHTLTRLPGAPHSGVTRPH